MSMDALDRARAAALACNVLITRSADPHLRSLPADMSRQVASRLSRLVPEHLRSDRSEQLCSELGLSDVLTRESSHRFQKSVSGFLLHLVADLRLHDVRTEVLEIWLAEAEASTIPVAGLNTATVGQGGGAVTASPPDAAA